MAINTARKIDVEQGRERTSHHYTNDSVMASALPSLLATIEEKNGEQNKGNKVCPQTKEASAHAHKHTHTQLISCC